MTTDFDLLSFILDFITFRWELRDAGLLSLCHISQLPKWNFKEITINFSFDSESTVVREIEFYFVYDNIE